MKDPYTILGVSKNASDDEIKEAYRNLARKYHPDNYGDDNPLKELANEKMQEINTAYDEIQNMRRGGSSYKGGGTYYDSYSGSTDAPPVFAEIRNLIKELGKEHTVILSSHILSEIRAVCDSVIIIDKGKIRASDTLSNLESTLNDTFTIKCEVKGTKADISDCLTSLSLNADLTEKDNIVSFELSVGKDIREDIFFAFADRKIPIISMTAVKSDIEDIFIQLTEEKEENDESDLSQRA